MLRIVAHAAGGSAALVARDGEHEPVAAWGCDAAGARALLRVRRRDGTDGATLFAAFPMRLADGASGEVLVVVPTRPFDHLAVDALAREIGAACGPEGVAPEPGVVERLTESIEQLGEAIAILEKAPGSDEPPRYSHVNAGFTTLFGFTPRDLVGRTAEVTWGPLTDRERMAWIRSRVAERKPARAAVVVYTKDGAPVWTELVASPVHHESPALHHIVTFRDVTARKQYEDALSGEKRKLQTTLAAIADAVVTVLRDGRIEFINAAAQRLIGIDLVDAYGAHVRNVLQLVDESGAVIDILECTRGGDAVRRGDAFLQVETRMLDVAYVASRIDSEEGGAVVVLRDVTAEHRLSMRLSFEAAHDPLTGLQNRRAFLERLEEALTGARERGEQHVVGFLDLDRFKVVNDSFGHATGDRLLREIGRVMGRVVRGGDIVARIGGDEFGLLLTNCGVDDARRVAEKVRDAVVAYRIEHEGNVLDVGVSIGLAPLDARVVTVAQALGEADVACYAAKAAGRNTIAGGS